MNALYVYQGTKLRQGEAIPSDAMQSIPAGFYIVGFDDDGFYLHGAEPFTMPTKIYGDTLKRADRILRTHKLRSGNTGVLLSGEKGSGKTLLAKAICLEAVNEGRPVLMVNSSFHGDLFNRFLQNINQQCVILFDEFEKVYNEEKQPHLLTVLDGVIVQQKLFVFTCNESSKVSTLMHNRPGRIFYHLEYKGLDAGFIKDYIDDRLEDKSKVEGAILVASLFSKFNFDMLSAMVEEMNRYDESAQEVLKFINAKPIIDAYEKFDAVLEVDGRRVRLYDRDFTGNPMLMSKVAVTWYKSSNSIEIVEYSHDDMKECNTDIKHFVSSG